MRFPVILLLLAACGLTAVATAPRVDLICLAQRAVHYSDPDYAHWSCLHFAAARGDVEVLGDMLAYGADIGQRNGAGRTALAEAARAGALGAVNTLLRQGADPNVYGTRSGFTPLHLAAKNQHPAVVRALLAAGAEVDAHNQWGQTPLWLVAWQDWQGNTEIAHILVAHGADVDRADDKGHTPLHMAARAGHKPMVGYLLAQGADPNHLNDRGRGPLYQAVVANHRGVARLLLAQGADPNRAVDGWPPLRLALTDGHRDMAELLTSFGATGFERYAAAARFERGKRLLKDGALGEAAAAFSEFIALSPGQARGYYYRGLALFRQGHAKIALRDFNRALALAPQHTDALESAAQAYRSLGDYANAVDLLERLAPLKPDSGRVRFLLAESLTSLGDTARAQALGEAACALGYRAACGQ